MKSRAGKQPSRSRLAQLALVGLVTLTLSAVTPTRLAGSEASGTPAAITNPFLGADAEQAPACGGPGQRACCFLERNAPSSCDDGLTEVALGQFPNACGIFPAGTCMPVAPSTACGGEGQRACCLTEGPACAEGLVYRGDEIVADLFVPASGDTTCRGAAIFSSNADRSVGSCIKATPDPIPEPTAGWTAPAEPRGILRGYLDMHLHLLGHMAHGAKNLVGEPAPIDATGQFVVDANHNINTALSPAVDLLVHKNPFHGITNDTSGDGTGDGSRTEFGAPYFTGWPNWTSTTHQQSYYVWLERAWRGGLRATTMFASHVESLCKTSLKKTRDTSWPICEDSMRHIVEQLIMARGFERFIDAQSGGAGLGWFRIVTTPQQAQAAVRAGKLAVVLGIEVDNLFNCKEAGCPADFGLPAARMSPLGLAQPTTLEEAVNVIYDLGVRHVFPVHNFDNGFGAAATWMDPIGVGQAIAEQRWWVTRDCGDGLGDYGFWLDNAIQDIMLFFGFGVFETPPLPFYTSGNLSPAYASCNQYGLTPLGPQLIQALMNKGMLIDIDHMSNYSLEQTVAATSRGPDGNGAPYPLVASHVQAFDLHQKEFSGNKGRHERMRTRAQLAAIRSSGGMVAAMLKDDVQDTDLKGQKFTLPYTPLFGAPIADDCRHSSKTFAQAFQFAVDEMGGPVAMGSDFNGQAGHFGPRFGSDACGGWGAPNALERPKQIFENSRVQYPFTVPGFGTFDQQVTGFRTFDYNVDGLAHIGLVPDMVADLERIGLDPHYLDSLFCSAEAYIRVWERADALAARLPPPDPNRPWQCNSTDAVPPASSVVLAPPAPSSGWYTADVAATITATDAGSGVDHINYAVTGAPLSNGVVAGDLAAVTLTGEGDRHLGFFATDVAGNVESPNTVTVKIDRTAPEIAVSRTPANAAGWNNGPVTIDFACTDTLSGIDTCAASQVMAGDGFGQSASGEAFDIAGNHAAAAVTDINIDRTAPSIVASRTPANAAGWNNTAVTVSFTCQDALSGIGVCSPSRVLSSDGSAQSASGEAIDVAANHAATVVTGINIDRTPPVVVVTGISNGATYDVGVVPPAGCTTIDALSGVATSAVVATSGGTSNGVGTFTAVCGGARDVAGNSGSATATYFVHYVFTGFMSPVNNLPTVNAIKAGQTVPVKFSLGGNHGLDVLLGGTATSATVGCAAGAPMDPLELAVASPGASVFSYNALSGIYQFNWKTEKTWANTCRRLLVRLDDGTVHTADFRMQ